MKVLISLYSFFSVFFFFKAADAVVDNSLAKACNYYETLFNWGCTKQYCQCKNNDWINSITYCVVSNTKSKDLVKTSFEFLTKHCESTVPGFKIQKFYDAISNSTNYLRDPTEMDTKMQVYGTLKVDPDKFDDYYKKMRSFTLTTRRSQWFGWGLFFYWCFIFAVATIINVNNKLIGFKLISNRLKKNILYPSIFKSYVEETFFIFKFIPINFTTRMNGLVITVFYILCCLDTGLGYCLEYPFPGYPSRWYANVTIVAYRTGILTMSLLPPLYLFGIRNNFFTPITGISFATFKLYHKCVAYAATILIFIHSIAWTVLLISKKMYEAHAREAFLRWGIVATTLMFIMIFLAEKVIRDMAYEFFLILHQCMSVLVIVGTYYHLKSIGWLGWVWAVVAIYAFDRTLRIIRIIVNGGIKDALITDCGNGVIKVTIKKPKFIDYQAGTYAYIYFLGAREPWFYFFQSHPFTILKDPEVDSSNNLVVYLKVNSGITKNILSRIIRSGKESIKVKIMIEGPYGVQIPQRVNLNRSLVGVSAGLGVTAVYSQFCNMINSCNTNESPFDYKFYWIVNSIHHQKWFNKELLWLQSKGCEVQLIYTGEPLGRDIEATSSSTSFHSQRASKSEFNINVHHINERPDLKNIIQHSIQICQEKNHNITFISCGPPLFNDHFREGITKSISHDLTIDVDYWAESFAW